MRATMTPQELADRFVQKFGSRVSNVQVKERCEGVKKLPQKTVWMTFSREGINDAVAELISIDYPHLGVIAASDNGDMIDLLYHLQVFFGGKHEEICVVFTVQVPKSDPHVPTISGLIPGAVYSEREKQDMIGIIVDGIPDSRRIFLPDDFPENVYPWRKDEKGIPASMVRELWKVDRPTDRAVPPVAEPEPAEKKESEPVKDAPSGGAAE